MINNDDKLAGYIARKQAAVKNNYLFNRIPVEEKDKLIGDVSLERVLRFIEKNIPEHLFGYVESIYIGTFPELEERDMNAAYSDGAIYVTNIQTSETDMLDDIIHELGHSVEQLEGRVIYSDGGIQQEFLAKRLRLQKYLEHEGHEVPEGFMTAEFSQKIDDFLFKEVGYGVLGGFTSELYPTPYAATSVSEYWATSFEEFFLGSKSAIQALSPRLYRKLNTVIYED